MSGSYLHPRCGKRVKNSAYHCARCHESFIGLTAFDGHQSPGLCNIVEADDPYTAKATEFWADDEGYWHRGRKMTEEQKKLIWG